MTTLEDLALDAYRRGTHPLDFAELVVQAAAEDVGLDAHDPAAAEDVGLDAHDPAAARLARRVLGYLLDAGWTMPEPPP
jgi:hypothetical protein